MLSLPEQKPCFCFPNNITTLLLLNIFMIANKSFSYFETKTVFMRDIWVLNIFTIIIKYAINNKMSSVFIIYAINIK